MRKIQKVNGKSIFKKEKSFNLSINALPCGMSVNITSEKKNKSIMLDSLEKKIEEEYQYYNLQNPILSVIKYCQKEKYMISTAESCTGGLIAKHITDVAGSSSIFLGSIVSYSNQIKQDILNVPKKIITQNGAISRECSKTMVRNILKLSKSDIAISTTGIAGPTGGTETKRIGLVYISIANKIKKEILTGKFYLPLGRERFRQTCVYIAFLSIYQRYVLSLNENEWKYKSLGRSFEICKL